MLISVGIKRIRASARTIDVILYSSESKRWDSKSDMNI